MGNFIELSDRNRWINELLKSGFGFRQISAAFLIHYNRECSVLLHIYHLEREIILIYIYIYWITAILLHLCMRTRSFLSHREYCILPISIVQSTIYILRVMMPHQRHVAITHASSCDCNRTRNIYYVMDVDGCLTRVT